MAAASSPVKLPLSIHNISLLFNLFDSIHSLTYYLHCFFPPSTFPFTLALVHVYILLHALLSRLSSIPLRILHILYFSFPSFNLYTPSSFIFLLSNPIYSIYLIILFISLIFPLFPILLLLNLFISLLLLTFL